MLETELFKQLNQNKMEKETFFMVYLEGERAPAFKHHNLNSAKIEAQRLCKTHNKKAFVMCSLMSFKLNEFKIEDCRPDGEDLPLIKNI